MLSGLLPKALRTTAGTEAKIAHRWEVYKDLFHLLREHGLPGCSCPHIPVPLPPTPQLGREGQGPSEGRAGLGFRGQSPPEPYPWAVRSPELSLAPGRGVRGRAG